MKPFTNNLEGYEDVKMKCVKLLVATSWQVNRRAAHAEARRFHLGAEAAKRDFG